MPIIAFQGPELLVSIEEPSIFEKRNPRTAVCAFSKICECDICFGCSHDPRYDRWEKALTEEDQLRFLAYHFKFAS